MNRENAPAAWMLLIQHDLRGARRSARSASRIPTTCIELTRDLMLREGMGRHKQYCSLPLFHESLAALGAGDFSSKLRAALAAEKKRRAD